MLGQLSRRNGPVARAANGDWMDAFRNEMDQMLTPVFGSEWLGQGVPTADVSETDQAIEVRLDLPGVKPEEIEINLDQNVLTIRGERHEESEEKEKKYHRIERRTGSFSRTFTLPQHVNEDEVVAEYRDGVLNVTLPKSEEAKSKKIQVKT